MSTEANKTAYRNLVDELFNKGNVAQVEDLMTEDFVENEQMDPSAGSGREAAKQMMTMMSAAFPDMQVTVDSIVAEGDLVAARLTWRGTHQGEFMGIPGTGKAIEFSGMDFVRFRDGKAAEHWGQTDVMALMTQLGAMEPPA